MKQVKIYTFATCPFCIKAKKLMDSEGIAYTEIDITNEREKLSELKGQTGCSTVPQIFVDENFIGGCDDVMSLHRNKEFDDIFK